MKQPVVRVKLRIKLSSGSRVYADPVWSPNGKLKPHFALVDGVPEHHPEGVYHLRYQRGERRVWEAVGSDPQLAVTAQKRVAAALTAKAAGVALAEVDESPARHIPLDDAIADYLVEVRANKSKKTQAAYALTLRNFRASCKRQYVEQIDRKDWMAFIAFLRDQGASPRTMANQVNHLKVFIHWAGATCPLAKNDYPKYTEKVVSAYTKEEIKALLAAADPDEALLLQFILYTGAREQEVMYATWPDIDFTARTFTITEKRDLGFTPKDKEEGVIPIPDVLIDLLKQRRKQYPNSRLIFCNTQGNPDRHLIRILKRVAKRAGLNCGHCVNKAGKSCATSATCSRFELHRLRKTFATMHHEAGVPARTIQRWLRHTDLSTTLFYLAASDDRSAKTRAQVNATFAEVTA